MIPQKDALKKGNQSSLKTDSSGESLEGGAALPGHVFQAREEDLFQEYADRSGRRLCRAVGDAFA